MAFRDVVISSASEKSLSFAVRWAMIRKIKTGNLLSADFRALLYLYSAALRSFDSAAIIQIIVSLTYSFFLRSG